MRQGTLVKPRLTGLSHEAGALRALAGDHREPSGNQSGSIREATGNPGRFPVGSRMFPDWFPIGSRLPPARARRAPVSRGRPVSPGLTTRTSTFTTSTKIEKHELTRQGARSCRQASGCHSKKTAGGISLSKSTFDIFLLLTMLMSGTAGEHNNHFFVWHRQDPRGGPPATQNGLRPDPQRQ